MSKPAQERTHGIASYNKGCDCEQCIAACRETTRKRRRRQRAQDPLAVHECRYGCGDKFRTIKGRGSHESHIHGFSIR